ncbi:hypothetical protein BCR35DRAFT_312898 [Leucosporidium creatinivorum]|uniref:histidine kinase n=1 Tax=Leucosporidium creatinivorum TaxID=106004 RepID=A0A1Y2FWK1_9BASI|nr:hypothetical protein BCR35DRAFT_312898 [Leucosporidium creatinivorum]
MDRPPRPKPPTRSATTGSHPLSATNSPTDALGRRATLSSDGSSPGEAPTEIRRPYMAIGNERVFPLRSVVHARPPTARRDTSSRPGTTTAPAHSPERTTTSPSVAGSPNSPRSAFRPRTSALSGARRSPLPTSPGYQETPFEWFPPAGDLRSPEQAGMPWAEAAEKAEESEQHRRSQPPKQTSSRVITSEGEYWISRGEPSLEEESLHQAGAVQPFVCLLALAEDEEGKFIVQQASESCSTILGHPPSALFSAPSFTTILTPESTDLFLDAVDALDDNDTTSQSSGGEGSDEQDDQSTKPTKTLPPPEHFIIALAGAAHHGERFYASLHRPTSDSPSRLLLEIEPENDTRFPLAPPRDLSPPPASSETTSGAEQVLKKANSVEETILRNTVSLIKPLKAIARRRSKRTPEINMVQLVYQIEEQLRKANTLEMFLAVTASVLRQVTGFDHVMVLQFDDSWNARVVSEDADHDLADRDLAAFPSYLGLTFPAAAVPSASFARTKVSLVYDCALPFSPMCSRTEQEAENGVDMTRCPGRAPRSERVAELQGLGMQATMTLSLSCFSKLWGVVTCSSARPHRISVPIRNLCTYLAESLSRTIERLSLERRLQARNIISHSAASDAPVGHIISDSSELLELFDADWGCLSVGDEAKLLGEVGTASELLCILEYLREKRFREIQLADEITSIFPDCIPPDPSGFKQIAGILVVPLSPQGADFIYFARRGSPHEINWVARNLGKPGISVWTQRLASKSTPWSDETLDTAHILSTIYGRFISVWREKESYVQANSVTSLLLANASHEVRTPLNAIRGFLELAMAENDQEGVVSEHLQRTHDASRALTHVINDLLDLTAYESGTAGELFTCQAFNLRSTIEDAISIQQSEATRRGLKMDVIEDPQGTPSIVLGDRAKVRQIVGTIVGNAVKYTETGSITITFGEINDHEDEEEQEETDTTSPVARKEIRISISIEDTGRGMEEGKLDALFSALHHVHTNEGSPEPSSIGLGLATTARIVEKLDGQLRVESKVGKGSRFQLIIPFGLPDPASSSHSPPTLTRRASSSNSVDSLTSRDSNSKKSEIDGLISAISSARVDAQHGARKERPRSFVIGEDVRQAPSLKSSQQEFETLSTTSLPKDTDSTSLFTPGQPPASAPTLPSLPRPFPPSSSSTPQPMTVDKPPKPSLKILVVEDEKINATLLERRLTKDSHRVTVVQHGGMAVRAMEEAPDFDLVLMDLNMPICDGWEASQIIRKSEPTYRFPPDTRRPRTHLQNGRVPILCCTANARERERDRLIESGIDGWCLKPVRFDRLAELIAGTLDTEQRRKDVYRPGEWERGGWFTSASATRRHVRGVDQPTPQG